MQGIIKLCFICAGNTCRSYMAEKIMKARLKKTGIDFVKVSSRGLFATGEQSADNACNALKILGYNSKKRKSVKLKNFDQKTLYVAMSTDIKNRINGKVIEMKDLIDEDIPDPYGKDLDSYLVCAKKIDKACEILIDKLVKIGGEIW